MKNEIMDKVYPETVEERMSAYMLILAEIDSMKEGDDNPLGFCELIDDLFDYSGNYDFSFSVDFPELWALKPSFGHIFWFTAGEWEPRRMLLIKILEDYYGK